MNPPSGELYNLKMLTARIMHECVLKLLGPPGAPPSDEESLESLCKLLTTVGKASRDFGQGGVETAKKYLQSCFHPLFRPKIC